MAGYVITHNGNTYDPNGPTEPVDRDAHNRFIERQELVDWATRPSQFAGYLSEDRQSITTWLGTPIAQCCAYRKRRNNFGAMITYIQAFGTNRCWYYGKLCEDSRQLIRLRAYKNRSFMRYHVIGTAVYKGQFDAEK